MKYYTNKNKTVIFKSEEAIDFISELEIELTKKQEELFEGKARLPYRIVFPPEPIIIPLEEHKRNSILNIDNESLFTLEKIIPTYKQTNILMGGVYSEEENTVLKQKLITVSNVCRNERYRLVELINKCNTNEEVDDIIATSKFAEIIEKYG